MAGQSKKVQQNQPQRARSAYNFFFQKAKDSIQEQVAKETGRRPGYTGLAKSIAASWKTLPSHEKAYYQKLAAQDRRRFAIETVQWKIQNESKNRDSNQANEEGEQIRHVAGISTSPSTAIVSESSVVDQDASYSSAMVGNQDVRSALPTEASQEVFSSMSGPLPTMTSFQERDHIEAHANNDLARDWPEEDPFADIWIVFQDGFGV